jgi:hypothetical protein
MTCKGDDEAWKSTRRFVDDVLVKENTFVISAQRVCGGENEGEGE